MHRLVRARGLLEFGLLVSHRLVIFASDEISAIVVLHLAYVDDAVATVNQEINLRRIAAPCVITRPYATDPQGVLDLIDVLKAQALECQANPCRTHVGVNHL